MKRPLLVLLLLGCVARETRAQATAAQLIQAARTQLEVPNPDSAAKLLETALQPGRGASVADQTRAFTLNGIAQLLLDNVAQARVMFRQALQRDASLRVDSLGFFHDALEREFSAERAAIAPNQPTRSAVVQLSVRVDVPGDTIVPAQDGRLRIETQPTYHARVVVSISPAENAALVVWSDTQDVAGVNTRTWNLRGRDGAIPETGRYLLRAKAIDSTGQASLDREKALVIGRVVVDTLPWPAPLTAFEQETLYLKRGSPGGLAAGLLVAASAVVLPSVLGNPDLQTGASYSTSYAVAGVVSVASVVGFLRGSRVRPMPGNALLNAQARERDASERQRIAQENARRRDAAPIRVRLEGAGQ